MQSDCDSLLRRTVRAARWWCRAGTRAGEAARRVTCPSLHRLPPLPSCIAPLPAPSPPAPSAQSSARPTQLVALKGGEIIKLRKEGFLRYPTHLFKIAQALRPDRAVHSPLPAPSTALAPPCTENNKTTHDTKRHMCMGTRPPTRSSPPSRGRPGRHDIPSDQFGSRRAASRARRAAAVARARPVVGQRTVCRRSRAQSCSRIAFPTTTRVSAGCSAWRRCSGGGNRACSIRRCAARLY